MQLPNKLTIHHSDSSRDMTTIAMLDSWHKLRWIEFKGSLGYWIGYHYVITGDGKVTQTRKDTEQGAHTRGYNEGNIGICLTGRFIQESPSEAQIKALATLIERLKMTYGIVEVKGHRDYNATECPGTELMKWILEQKVSWLKRLIILLNKIKL
jgi:hypothetical protein